MEIDSKFFTNGAVDSGCIDDLLNDSTLQQYLLDNSLSGLQCDHILNQQAMQNIAVDPSLFSPQSGYDFDQQNAFSTESLTDDGSPYSIGYNSPNGSTDSGILCIDLSTPSSPISPLSNGSSMNITNTPDMNFPMPVTNLLQDENIPITQVDPQSDALIKQLQQQIAFYHDLNNDKLKDHLEKQQQQQKLLQNQIIYNLQQKELLERNLNSIQAQPLTVESLPQEDMSASSKENQLKRILSLTRSNFDKKKHNLLNTIQETKGKMKFKGNKSGKRKLPPVAPAPFKQNKTQAQDQFVDLEEAKATVNDLQKTNLTTTQNSALASLLLQPKAARSSETSITTGDSIYPLIKPSTDYVVPVTSSSTLFALQQQSTASSNLTTQDNALKGSGGKKTRVEHIVIEKRYRMKITESLKELKHMLGCHDEKKSTKNGILQAAIIEIKKLRKENQSLRKKTIKMSKLFEELKNIGIIPQSQHVVPSSSESDVSERSLENSDDTNVEPEINQDHYVSPLSRQSARDGAKTLTCFAMFLFLFITPFGLMTSAKTSNRATYSSRHLLNVLDQDTSSSPQYFLLSKVIHVFLTVFMLMFMVLRGNPHCIQNPKIVLCFKGQLQKAQKKINKKSYDDAKGFLRIALFIIGNSCPKTLHGQWASFLWKCICHILYQLGIISVLESMSKILLPKMLSGASTKCEQDFTAKLSVKAYKKLHEIALKDPSSTYLEAACYLMNVVHSAEVSGDQELIATAYSISVVHMKEKVKFFSYILQYYFTSCAHHASLLSQDTHPYAVDWIFERYGYDFFTCRQWNVNKQPAFNVTDLNSDLDEADLLQIVYAQFQDYSLSKALKRLVVPETFYPNEGKIELRQRAISMLEILGTGPPSEQIDSSSLFHQAVYGWWRSALTNMLLLLKNEEVSWNDMESEEELYQDINELDRSKLIVLSKSVFSTFMTIQQIKNKSLLMSSKELTIQTDKVRWKLHEASQLLSDSIYEDASPPGNEELHELIQIMCCNLLIDASFILWSLDKSSVMIEQELNFLTQQNEVLKMYSLKYSELAAKVQDHDYQIQAMSGASDYALNTVLKRSKHIKLVRNQTNELNNIYFITQNYPLKQDGFVRN